MSQRWILVFPAGDRTRLSMALAFDYEEKDFLKASRKSWDWGDKDFAVAYGIKLADKHNLIKDNTLLQQEEVYLD